MDLCADDGVLSDQLLQMLSFFTISRSLLFSGWSVTYWLNVQQHAFLMLNWITYIKYDSLTSDKLYLIKSLIYYILGPITKLLWKVGLTLERGWHFRFYLLHPTECFHSVVIDSVCVKHLFIWIWDQLYSVLSSHYLYTSNLPIKQKIAISSVGCTILLLLSLVSKFIYELHNAFIVVVCFFFILYYIFRLLFTNWTQGLTMTIIRYDCNTLIQSPQSKTCIAMLRCYHRVLFFWSGKRTAQLLRFVDSSLKLKHF